MRMHKNLKFVFSLVLLLVVGFFSYHNVYAATAYPGYGSSSNSSSSTAPTQDLGNTGSSNDGSTQSMPDMNNSSAYPDLSSGSASGLDAGQLSPFAIFALVFVVAILLAIAYVYFGYCLYVIAKRTGTKHAWMAWVPILNGILQCWIGKKSGWWLLLLLIPFINVFFLILIWMEIAKAVGKQEYYGILIAMPGANVALFAYFTIAAKKLQPAPVSIQ